MKITCQSCQSKYNVADEKVEGKIVKIRCRKCGATIVVNGTGGAATNGTTGADAAAQQDPTGAGDGASWHVNVADNDQRTLTLAELVEAYNAGVVTQETFIWCDGMDDWRPLGEVDAVVTALHAGAPPVAQAVAAPSRPGAFAPPVTAAPAPKAAARQEAPAAEARVAEAPAYEAPPYVAPAAYVAPAPEPKRAAVAKRETRARDLFATSTGGEELHTSAPVAPQAMVPALDTSSPTGQRNENSVLFSLAVLTKNADARPASMPPVSSREDSGLIDLKALAQKAESMRPMAMGDGDVFHSPLGLTPSPLGAPVGVLGSGQEAQPKSKLPMMIGGGAVVLLLCVVCVVLGVKLAGAGAAPVAAPTAATTATATAEPSATAAPVATAESSASAAPSGSVAALKKPGLAAWHPTGAPGGAVAKPPSGSGGSGGATPAPTPTPTPKKSGGDCGCNGDLMCLMKCSTH